MLQSAVRVLTWEGAEKTEGVDARGVVTEALAIVALRIGMQLVVCWEQHAHVLSKSHHLLYGRKATVPSTSPPDTVQCCSQLSEC